MNKIFEIMLKLLKSEENEVAKDAAYFFLEYLCLDANENQDRILQLKPVLKEYLH